jgi:hypothetical protein
MLLAARRVAVALRDELEAEQRRHALASAELTQERSAQEAKVAEAQTTVVEVEFRMQVEEEASRRAVLATQQEVDALEATLARKRLQATEAASGVRRDQQLLREVLKLEADKEKRETQPRVEKEKQQTQARVEKEKQQTQARVDKEKQQLQARCDKMRN